MNSLNRFRPAKQFRCLPLVGKDSPFGYVERLNDQGEVNNYQPDRAMVEAFSLMNEKGREEWLKLTGGSKTTEVSQSTLSETRRVIYLREGYDHECFSPLEQFQRKFTELKDCHEPVNAIPADSD